MSYDDLPDELKEKLLSELDDADGGGNERLLILEEQNSFVQKFLRRHKIAVRFDGSIQWRECPGVSRDVFLTKVLQEYRLFAARRKIASPNRLKRADLKDQFKELIYDNRAESLHRLENTLRYQQQCEGELCRFVEALLPVASSQQRGFAANVFASFIWQVKRKIAGLPVEHHVMPILYSKTHGTGKSVSVGKLVAPLEEFVLHSQMGIFGDQFFRRAFADNFVVVFDELQGAGRTDIESMKNVITAATLSSRGMHTQDVDSTPQNCTFIGTTNKAITDLIFDNTGMRRFVELELGCMANLELITGERWEGGERHKVDHPIDFLKVWRGVSEHGLNPILSVREELELHQEELRTKTTLEQWVDEFELHPGEVPNNLQVLFNHYKDWLDLQRKQPGMIAKFSRDLKTLGFGDAERKTVQGKRARWVDLNKDISGLKT